MELIVLNRSDSLYQKALDLRYDLFFRERGLPRDILFDSLEHESIHVAIKDGTSLLAYGRLSQEDAQTFKISQMVVQPDYQGQGLGFKVLKKLVETALEIGAHEIYLNARLHAVPMYEKLGFNVIGETFVAKSTGVPHVKMSQCGRT